MRLRGAVNEDESFDLGVLDPVGEPVPVQAPERV